MMFTLRLSWERPTKECAIKHLKMISKFNEFVAVTMMALARAARRRLLPRGAPRPTSRGAVTTTFLPENREWHEPAVLSAAAASFRDDELRLLDALAEAAAASLDRAVEASAAEACLNASVAAAGDGDAAALLADFAARARGDLAARVGAGATAAPLAAGETLRLAYAARFAERVAVALFPPGGDRYGALPPPAGRGESARRALADAGAAALLEPAAAAPGAAASPRLGAKVRAALEAACAGDGAARVAAAAALADGDDDGLVDVAEARAALYAAAAPVADALADAHGHHVAAALGRDHAPARRFLDRGAARRLRAAARGALRHLDRNANDALDLPAKARCVAAWAEPDRVDDPPEPPPVLSAAWFAHRGGADGRAYVRPAALAEATDEFFPEHAKLGKELATALLRHREQFWREHEEGKTSAYLTGAFCLFCAAADYAIMAA